LQPRPQILFCARPQINQAAVAIFSQFQRGMCVPDVWATPHAVQSAAICFTGSASGLDTTQANDHHLLVTRTESASESWPEHLRRLRVESFTGVLAKNSPHLAG